MSNGTKDEILPYSSIHLAVGEKDAALTAMCHGVRMYIQVNSENLLGIQNGAVELTRQLTDFLNSIDDEPEAMQAFEDWLIQPCFPHIRHLASLENRTAKLSLHAYFHPPTFIFTLENVRGQLEARKSSQDSSLLSHLTPRVSVSDPAVSSAVQHGIPCIVASQVLAIREPDLSDWEYNEIPKLVQRIDAQSQQLYFKAAFERGSFVRELDTLMRIKHISDDLRVTRLVGFVQWEDDHSIAGLLMEYIPKARTLDWAVDDSTYDDRTRWMAELRHTVGRLHDADIIWGDVKPQNVLIDPEGHAWVVDFGGGYSLSWVSKDMHDTMDGDLQGLDAIARYLGLGFEAVIEA